MKNRWYSPTLGRFLTTDPIAEHGGVNLYAYCGNEPVGHTDPLGLDVTASATNAIVGVIRLKIYELTHPLESTGTAMGVMGNLVTLDYAEAQRIDQAHRDAARLNYSATGGESEWLLAGKTTVAGGATVLNQLTFEKVSYFVELEDGTWREIGMEDTAWHTGSKVFAVIGREAAITALTMGNSQLARGGTLAKGTLANAINYAARSPGAIKAAQVAGKAIIIYDVGSGSYQLGTGIVEISEDPTDYRGYLDVLGGGLRVGGGFLSAREMGIVENGGRLGSPLVRNQSAAIADEAQDRGWTLVKGGGAGNAEEWIPPVGGGRAGGAYPDITLMKNGKYLRVNTVTTLKDGVTMTLEEARNAARIRAITGRHLLTVPKPNVTLPWNHSFLPAPRVGG